MTYQLLFPVTTCRFCDGSEPTCTACVGTGEIVHGMYSEGLDTVIRWVEVHSADAEGSDLEIAEEVFTLFNIGDRPVNVRSMSVGDRIVIDGRLYSCAMFGFEAVEVAA